MNNFKRSFLDNLRFLFFQMVHKKNKNIKVGKNLQLHCWLSIKGPGKVVIGDNCTVFAMPGGLSNVVSVNTYSSNAVLTVGGNTCLVSARLGCKFEITIGDNVVVEDASIMDTDFHSLALSRESPSGETVESCRIIIKNKVHIASQATILKGTVLGTGAHVYAGSVVQKSFAPYAIIIGNPAKQIGSSAESVGSLGRS